MVYYQKMLKKLLLAVFLCGNLSFATEILIPSKLEALIKKDCTLVHLWAIWCSICVSELEDVISYMDGGKSKTTPVMIEVSSPFVQDSLSVKHIAKVKKSFPMYLKPADQEKAYYEIVQPNWDGALPLTVLFSKGRRVEKWTGEIKSRFNQITQSITQNCR